MYQSPFFLDDDLLVALRAVRPGRPPPLPPRLYTFTVRVLSSCPRQGTLSPAGVLPFPSNALLEGPLDVMLFFFK